MRVPFVPARAKLWIGSIDDPSKEVRAQYNPKEIQVDKQIGWGEHKDKVDVSASKRPKPDASDQDDLELTGAPRRSMSIELLFDGFENKESIEPDIRMLEELSALEVPGMRKGSKLRPHHCLVVWGASTVGMRPFRCVIESLSTKYTMWDEGGKPLRATCTVKLKEARWMEKTLGFQEPEYGEKRRPPWWEHSNDKDVKRGQAQDRATLAYYDSLDAEKYDQLFDPSPRPAPAPPRPPGARPASPPPLSPTPQKPGRGR